MNVRRFRRIAAIAMIAPCVVVAPQLAASAQAASVNVGGTGWVCDLGPVGFGYITGSTCAEAHVSWTGAGSNRTVFASATTRGSTNVTLRLQYLKGADSANVVTMKLPIDNKTFNTVPRKLLPGSYRVDVLATGEVRSIYGSTFATRVVSSAVVTIS